MRARVLTFLPILSCALLHSQSQYALITASGVQDEAGNKLASGTITFTPVLTPGSTLPASPHLVGGGRGLGTPVTFNVTEGVISAIYGTAQLVDVTQALPANFCYADSIHDNNAGDTWTPDACVQPAYNASWCSVSGGQTTCNFDNYVPTGTPGALQTSGPMGPVGVLNQRGAWTASTAYAKDDGFTDGGNLYIVTAPYTSGGTFGSTDTSNSVEVNTVNGTSITPSTVSSSVNAEINVTSPPYNAIGDCLGSGSTSACNGPANCTGIQAAFVAAKAIGASVYFPINPAQPTQTIYYTSCTINPMGVSFHGPVGSQGAGDAVNTTHKVAIRGAPGLDVFAVGDPSSSGYVVPSLTFAVRDIAILVDDTVDSSSTFPHRKPGRTLFDGVMTASSGVLTSSTAAFSPGDVNQAIQVNGAGTSGANLVTTINSWQSATQVTLTAAASTSVSATPFYVSVVNLPVTQTIGNCGFAYDATNYVGAYVGIGTIGSDFTNVNMDVIDNQGIGNGNHSCGFFFQGGASPYLVHWENDFVGAPFAMVFVPSDGSAAALVNQCPGICDYNVFDHTWLIGAYPFISYGGNDNTFRDVQITEGNFGPQILGFNESAGSSAYRWNLDIPEMETTLSSCSGTAMRLTGAGHTTNRLNTPYCPSGGMVFQWDANDSPIESMQPGVLSSFNVTGNNDLIRIVDFINGVPSAWSITGLADLIITGSQAGPINGAQPARAQYAYTGASTFGPPQASRGSIVFDRTHDFIEKGALGYYFNDEDLWLWPHELTSSFMGGQPPIANDATSPTGSAIQVAAGSGYLIDVSNGSYLIFGQQIPAAKLRFYFWAKGSTSITGWNWNFASNNGGYNTLCSGISSLTTSYQLYYCDGDASAQANYHFFFDFGAPSTGTVSIAWVGIRPWYSDLEVNGPVSASSVQVGGVSLTSSAVGTVSSSSGTTTTAHTFTAAFSATPTCTATAESNAGAWYFSTLPSTTSSGVVTYATSGAQTFSESCTGAGGVW